MGSWVEDFSHFKTSTAGSGFNSGFSTAKGPSREGSGGILLKPQTRADKIKAELKLLEWHKLANDSAIKAALMQTKILKEDGTGTVVSASPSSSSNEMNTRWMKQVIDDENNKPLEVSKDFVFSFEKEEKRTQEKLTSQVERHIATLKMLRSKLEEQSELQSRQEEYREWRKDFRSKKAAVLTGKTLTEINASTTKPDTSGKDKTGGVYSTGKSSAKYPGRDVGSSQGKELSTVLDSLTKLAELERRISLLETDNAYDSLAKGNSAINPMVNPRTTLEFRKKRTAGGPQESVRSVYAVREKKQAWLPSDPLMRKKTKPGAAYASRGVLNRGGGRGGVGVGGGGYSGYGAARGNGQQTFLTENPDVDEESAEELEDPREVARRERARLLALAPAGQKELRARVQIKKERARVMAAGAKRHEQALQQMNQRRTEYLVKSKPKPVVLRPAKGASSGVKHKNRHLQEFENIKRSYNIKKDFTQMKASKTVPMTRPRPLAPEYPQNRRIPATQSGGTVTRRTKSIPQRRSIGEGQGEGAGAAGVVQGGGIRGVRGLRAIR